MNLFEIDQEIASCVKLPSGTIVNMETGEVIDIEALNALEMERDRKIENIALWYKNLLADAEALKRQKNIFAEREKAATNKAKSLKEYLSEYLCGKKWESTRVALSFRKTTALEVDSSYIHEIPEAFLKFKEPDLDKRAITNAIKSGQEIPGCRLVDGKSLQIK